MVLFPFADWHMRVDLTAPPQQMENVDAERDVYDELLTQAEIQGNVNKVNGERPALDSPRRVRRLAATFNRLLLQWQTQ